MRAPRPAVSAGLSTLLALFACSDGATSPDLVAPSEELLQAPHGATASLSAAPGGVPFTQHLTGQTNPCTGELEDVTITGTFWVLHSDGNTFVWRSQSTVTSTGGFYGRKTDSVVENRNVFKLSLNVMVAHPSGQRFRIHFIQLVDLTTGEIRVLQASGAVCLGN